MTFNNNNQDVIYFYANKISVICLITASFNKDRKTTEMCGIFKSQGSERRKLIIKLQVETNSNLSSGNFVQ